MKCRNCGKKIEHAPGWGVYKHKDDSIEYYHPETLNRFCEGFSNPLVLAHPETRESRVKKILCAVDTAMV